MTSLSSSTCETRNRLIEAAGEVFAEQGFRNATVRDICDRAGANLASVNYHFQSKEQLYATVLRHAHGCSVDQYPPTCGLGQHATPRERLLAFVRSFLLRIFDTGRPAWFGKLMAREMVEPTAALDELVERGIRPQAQMLSEIVRSIVSDPVEDDLVRRCVASIVGQCVFYHHARPVIERLYPEQAYQPSDIGQIAQHITQFSYEALQHLRSGEQQNRAEVGS